MARAARTSPTNTPNGDAALAFAPRLRFPEFRKSKAWRLTALGEVLFEHGLKSDGKSEVHSVSLTCGVVPQVEHLGRSFAASDTSHYTLVRPFDVVYTRSPLAVFRLGIVKQHRREHNAIVSPLYGVFTPTNKHVGQLVEAFFDSPARSVGLLDPLAQKGAKNTIQLSNERFLSARMYLPENEREQHHVADCLTSLDDLIAAQAHKVEALKAHKKGLMHNLFPREGEAVPRLRFPEFRDGPEWDDRKGGDLFRNRKDDGEPGLPIYSVTVNDGMVPRATFDRDFYDIEDPAGNRKACRGDLAYNMMRMWQGAQGVAPEDCMVSPAYVVLAPLERTSSEFFAQIFKLPASLRLLASHSRGLTKDRLRLYFEDFARMPLRVPCLAEQQRIAACLFTLDARLAAEAARLDALKAHKKGLMQGLFPQPFKD